LEEGLSFDLSAAAWRQSLSDEKSFVEALATRLSGALPDKTQVTRERKLFSKVERVRQIIVAFDRDEYLLNFDPSHGVRTDRATVVRGIRLKTESVSFPEWLSALSAEITAYAQEHQHVRALLEEFLMS